MHPHIPSNHSDHLDYTLRTITRFDLLAEPPRKRVRQGSLVKKQLRVVCHACNNQWMSRLETAAKPLLMPLILGRPATLTADNQATLARWFVMKAMVAERRDPRDSIYSSEDRMAFHRDLRMPFGVQIHAGLGESAAAICGYRRETMTLLTSEPAPGARMPKNVHEMAVGIGFLFVRLELWTNPDLERADSVVENLPLLRIWPVSETAAWPPRAISASEAAGFATALSSALRRNPRARFVL